MCTVALSQVRTTSLRVSLQKEKSRLTFKCFVPQYSVSSSGDLCSIGIVIMVQLGDAYGTKDNILACAMPLQTGS